MKIFIIVLLTFALGAFGEMRGVFYYQDRVTFDKRMLGECLNTTEITRMASSMNYITCQIEWTPYIDTLTVVVPTSISKFETECYGLIGEIHYDHIILGGYYQSPPIKRGDVANCLLANVVGNHYDFSFIGVLPPGI